MLKKYSFVALFILLVSTIAWAQTVPIELIDTQTLPDFRSTLKTLKEKTKLPVIFPQKIPPLPKQNGYYLYVEADPGTSRYIISMDKTADCHGRHNCMIGSLIASTGGTPQVHYSMENREITVPVKLAGGKTGYFTPSHAMADFWAPQIEWREGNILYQLSWNLVAQVPEKETLIAMVDSAIKY